MKTLVSAIKVSRCREAGSIWSGQNLPVGGYRTFWPQTVGGMWRQSFFHLPYAKSGVTSYGAFNHGDVLP